MTDRELDALVATEVMGEDYIEADPTQRYSTDIAAAWEVVEKLRGDGFVLMLEGEREAHVCEDQERYFADFFDGDSNNPKKPGTRYGRANADTAPRAICLAALRAKGVEVGESDLVERLRHNSRVTSYRPVVDEMLLEAADEIERLDGMVRELSKGILRATDELDGCNHYRAALERIAKGEGLMQENPAYHWPVSPTSTGSLSEHKRDVEMVFDGR